MNLELSRESIIGLINDKEVGEDFVLKNINLMDELQLWKHISTLELSDEFIDKYFDKLDKYTLSEKENLSPYIVRKYFNSLGDVYPLTKHWCYWNDNMDLIDSNYKKFEYLTGFNYNKYLSSNFIIKYRNLIRFNIDFISTNIDREDLIIDLIDEFSFYDLMTYVNKKHKKLNTYLIDRYFKAMKDYENIIKYLPNLETDKGKIWIENSEEIYEEGQYYDYCYLSNEEIIDLLPSDIYNDEVKEILKEHSRYENLIQGHHYTMVFTDETIEKYLDVIEWDKIGRLDCSDELTIKYINELALSRWAFLTTDLSFKVMCEVLDRGLLRYFKNLECEEYSDEEVEEIVKCAIKNNIDAKEIRFLFIEKYSYRKNHYLHNSVIEKYNDYLKIYDENYNKKFNVVF